MFFSFIGKHKKAFLVAFIALVSCSFTFATGSASDEMSSTVGNIVNFFSSGWVKGIACIALIGECLGLLFAGGQNPQVFKKFLPLIIGTVLFMCAGKIVTLIFGSSTVDFNSDLNGMLLREQETSLA